MSAPASAGPSSAARALPPSMELFACDMRVSSSPTSSGRIVRCAAKYGGAKAPRSATIASSSQKWRIPAAYSSGIDARMGARAKSATSIVVLEPSRCTSEPLGTPRIAIGRSSAARTRLILLGEPVVTRTNHGRARYVMRVPSTEIVSARTSALTARRFTGISLGCSIATAI